MKKIIVFVILLSLLKPALAQQNIIDSLKRMIAIEKNDTTRVILLNMLNGYFANSKPDSSLLMAQQALELSIKTNFKKGEAVSLNRMGNAFMSMANYGKALTYFLKTLEISEQRGDSVNMAKALSNIGIVYSGEREYSQSIIYTQKALAMGHRLNNPALLSTPLINLGDAYEKMNKLDSALFYTRQANKLIVNSGNNQKLAIVLNNTGNIYGKLQQPDTALYYYRLAIPLFKLEQDNDGVSESAIGMANAFKQLGQRDSSLFYARQSIYSGIEGGFIDRVLAASEYLTDYFKQQGRFDSAFHYQELLIAAKDSLFSQEKFKEIQNLTFAERQRQQDIIEKEKAFQASIRYYGLIAAIIFLIVLAFILWRNSRQRHKANHLLTGQNAEIEKQKNTAETALTQLKVTQTQLVQSAKMASLGELTAGIAHEIQNPLNFVNNFSEVNYEMIGELEEELKAGRTNEALAIAQDIKRNEEKITHHGKRANFIVKGMLEHSRTSKGEKTVTNINILADEYLKLSYHGLRAKNKSFNAEIITHFDKALPKLNVGQQDVGRVLLNLFNNAFYAVGKKQKTAGSNYKPTVEVTTLAASNGGWEIKIKDNGIGIPSAIKDKIMQPFFTTKPTGEGTGLGLSLSYDIIVKGHNGNITVNSQEGEYSEFIILIPTTQLN